MTILKQLSYVIGALSICVATVTATPKTEPMRFQRAAIDIGGEPTTAMMQDRDGFLWIGTISSGVLRYDGYSLKKFAPGPNSLSAGWVNSLYQDKEGIIWIGTSGGGLNRYDKKSNSFKVYKSDPKNPKSISSNNFMMFSPLILEDIKNPNLLWLGTDGGLNLFDKKSDEFTRFQPQKNLNSLSDNNIYSLAQDREGILWIATKKGLNRFDPVTKQFRRYLTNTEIWSIEDQDSVLWVGTKEGWLNKFNKKSGSITQEYNFGVTILGITPLSTGELALCGGAAGNGLVLFNPKTKSIENYTSTADNPQSLSTLGVRSVFEDSRGILWVINNSGQVDKFDRTALKLRTYQGNPANPGGLSYPEAFPRIEDRNGALWIGSTSKLNRYDSKTNTFTSFTATQNDPTSLPGTYSAGIYEDPEGTLWVGTYPGGMASFDPATGKATKQVPINAVYTIVQDTQEPDILWCGTYLNGLNKYNKKTGEIVQYMPDPKNPKSISSPLPFSVIQDNDNPNIFWIGMVGSGIEKFDKKTGTFTHFMNNPDDSTSIVSNMVWQITRSSEGTLWVSTDRGFSKFNTKTGKFKNFTPANGFPAQLCHFSIEDNKKNLWIASDAGLLKFDMKTEKVVKIYTESDGLASRSFFCTAYAKSKNGTLWIGGFKGMNSFNPDSLKDNGYLPPVYLTSLTQGGDPMEVSSALEEVKEITLDWRSNFFEFEFAALNFTLPEKNQYQYKLEGFEKEWYDAGTLRKGRYSSLPAGTYTLLIRGSNNDGVWSDKEVALKVIVKPAPWLSAGAYALYTLLIFGLIAGYILNQRRLRARLETLVDQRTEQLEREKKKAEVANEAKSAFLSNMSHEIRTPMNAILGFTEILKERITDPQNSKYLGTIQTSGNALLNLINDILDLSKIEAGKMELNHSPVSLKDLAQEMETVFFQKIDAKGLLFNLDLDENLPVALILDETRLRQILINLIGNAIKFTHEGQVALRIHSTEVPGIQSRVNLTIAVEDSGIGIPEDQQEKIFRAFEQVSGQDSKNYGGTGLGLSISKRLAEMMKGSISCVSVPGKGTTFTVTISDVEVSATEALSKQVHTLDYSRISFEPATILITDDVDYNREMIATYLAGWNFTPLFASNGKEAIAIGRDKKPDMILMDMKMPIMDGFEASERIKGDDILKNIPLVAVTASAFKEDEHRISQFCDGYLRKPVSKSRLVTEIMKYLPHTLSDQVLATEDVQQETVKIPSAELLLELKTMAENGYMQRIESFVMDLKKRDGSFTPFADMVLHLVSAYDDDGIIALVEKYLG